MKTWSSRLFRLFSGILAAAAFVLTLAIVALGAALYVGAAGHSVAVVREIAKGAGHLLAGQRTHHVDLELDVDPAAATLTASSVLEVRAEGAPRRYFHFLLNPGLRLQDVRVEDASGRELDSDAYRLLLLATVELAEPVPAGTSIRIAFTYAGSPTLEPFGGDSAALRADRVLLGPETFWYPYDAQSFFSLDATVRLPADLELVHNGVAASRVDRGETREVQWRSERPVAGLALVAGDFVHSERRVDGVTYRVAIPPDIPVDAESILDDLAFSHDVYRRLFGDSGYSRFTIFVDPGLRRAFNDGSGAMGIPPRYFRDGDEGFHIVAHELAHVWWGGTVSEQWLSPGTGGQWLVEGLATTSAGIATEARFGDAGLERVRRENFFDPDVQSVIEDMSFLDNALSIGTARDTIYRKGGYVGLLLRHIVGADAFARGLAAFLDEHRFSQASLADLQTAMETAASEDLSSFFDEWLRTDHLPDLGLEATEDGRVAVRNDGRLPIVAPIALAQIDASGAVTRDSVRVGSAVAAPPADGALVLDPDLVWPDVERMNNRFPRIDPPVRVAAGGDHLVVVRGSGLPWDRSSVHVRSRAGDELQTWDFARGIVGGPHWSPDATRVVVAVSRAGEVDGDIVVLETDGTRRRLGRGSEPIFDSHGEVVAVRDGVVVRFTGESAETWIELDGWSLETPRPSPNGEHLLYRAVDGPRLHLRARDLTTGEDRLLYEGERDRTVAVWARDGSAVYAIVGHGTAWRLLRLPLVSASASVLASDIASVADMELAPGGTQLALTAAAAPAYPDPQHRVYVIDLESQNVDQIEAGGDARDLTWTTASELVVTVRDVPSPEAPRVPVERMLRRIDVATGDVLPFP